MFASGGGIFVSLEECRLEGVPKGRCGCFEKTFVLFEGVIWQCPVLGVGVGSGHMVQASTGADGPRVVYTG